MFITVQSEYWRNKIKPEQLWNQTVPFFKRTKILGTACEFGLSLISLALSECMSHVGLNTNARAIIKVSGHQHQWFPGVSQVVTM